MEAIPEKKKKKVRVRIVSRAITTKIKNWIFY